MIQSTMIDIGRIALTLGIILLLIRRGIGIGYVMLISSAVLALLFGMGIPAIVSAATKAATGHVTITLFLSLSLIRIFELVLREQNILSMMMKQIRSAFRFPKAVMISMPLLIGMLPSLGGAYFSAPMVREATEGAGMSNDEKAFINYWFRHPWEFVLPLYPGIVFASAVSGADLNRLIRANAVCALMMLAAGFIFSMRGVRSSINVPTGPSEVHWTAWLNFLPIVAVLGLVIPLHLQLHVALTLVLVPLLVIFRYGPPRILHALRYGFSPEVIVMVAGIMLFKEVMEASGAVMNLSRLFIGHGVPLMPVFCALPFVAGLLTGHTLGFVGSTFPILVSAGGVQSPALIPLAFTAGFAGVLLSPAHLCLVLTREYFGSGLSGIYRRTIPAGLLVFAAALVQYMFL